MSSQQHNVLSDEQTKHLVGEGNAHAWNPNRGKLFHAWFKEAGIVKVADLTDEALADLAARCNKHGKGLVSALHFQFTQIGVGAKRKTVPVDLDNGRLVRRQTLREKVLA